MAEYIEREAAIAEVTMMAEDRRIPVNSYGGEVVGEVISILRRIPAADVLEVKWIPVTDRLPDTMKDKSVYSGWSAEIAPSDDVLCYLGSEKRQTVAWYSHKYKGWTTVDENTVYEYGKVTHWMPLPQPPKEE